MRKRIFLAAALAAILLASSCGLPSGRKNPDATAGSSADTTEPVRVTWQITPILFSGLDELAGHSDIILIGKVSDAPPTVRVDAAALGIVEGVDEFEKNISSFVINVEDVLKGDAPDSGTIRVDMNGGTADGVSETYDGLEFPQKGSRYLMFIRRTNFSEKNKYFLYMFVGTYDGFVEIVDGKIIPEKNSSVFTEGTSIGDILDAISKSVRKA